MAEVEHIMGTPVVRVSNIGSDNGCLGCVFNSPVFEEGRLTCKVLVHLNDTGRKACYDSSSGEENIFVPPGLAERYTAYAVAKRLEGAK